MWGSCHLGQVFWLRLDYLAVAAAALRCAAPFTALLFLEYWAKEHHGRLTLGEEDLLSEVENHPLLGKMPSISRVIFRRPLRSLRASSSVTFHDARRCMRSIGVALRKATMASMLTHGQRCTACNYACASRGTCPLSMRCFWRCTRTSRSRTASTRPHAPRKPRASCACSSTRAPGTRRWSGTTCSCAADAAQESLIRQRPRAGGCAIKAGWQTRCSSWAASTSCRSTQSACCRPARQASASQPMAIVAMYQAIESNAYAFFAFPYVLLPSNGLGLACFF